MFNLSYYLHFFSKINIFLMYQILGFLIATFMPLYSFKMLSIKTNSSGLILDSVKVLEI